MLSCDPAFNPPTDLPTGRTMEPAHYGRGARCSPSSVRGPDRAFETGADWSRCMRGDAVGSFRRADGGRRAGKSKGRTRTRHPVTQLLTQWQGIPSKLREGRVPNTAEVASSGAAPSSTPEMAPVFSLVSFSTRESSMGERRKKRPKPMQGAGYRLLHRMRSVFFLPGIEREGYPSIIDRPIHSIHLRDTIHSYPILFTGFCSRSPPSSLWKCSRNSCLTPDSRLLTLRDRDPRRHRAQP